MEQEHYYNEYMRLSLEESLAANEKLIWKVCHDFKRRNFRSIGYAGLEMEDLFSEAKVQFIKSYLRYDGSYTVATYFYKHMMYALQRYIYKHGNLIKFSNHHIFKVKHLNREYGENSKEVTVDFIMDKFNVKKMTAQNIYDYYHFRFTPSLNYTVRNANNSEEDEECMNTIIGNDFDTELLIEDIFSRVKMKDQEKMVLRLKYELYENVHIAEIMGISRQRVYQIVNQIKNKLNKYYEYDLTI